MQQHGAPAEHVVGAGAMALEARILAKVASVCAPHPAGAGKQGQPKRGTSAHGSNDGDVEQERDVATRRSAVVAGGGAGADGGGSRGVTPAPGALRQSHSMLRQSQSVMRQSQNMAKGASIGVGASNRKQGVFRV